MDRGDFKSSWRELLPPPMLFEKSCAVHDLPPVR